MRNLVSNGPGGGDAALYMTYIFDTRHPDVEAGSEEHARRKAAALAVSLLCSLLFAGESVGV